MDVNSICFIWRLYLVCFPASPSILFWLVLFDHIYLMKDRFKIYNAFYIRFILSLTHHSRSQRCERADLRVRKSNAIMHVVPLAHVAVAEAFASLIAVLIHAIAYYID